jgi:hypothetical protein
MTFNAIFKRKTLELFEDIVTPTNFFTSFYRRNEPTSAFKISQDIIRKVERVTEDVPPGTGPVQLRRLDPFTNKEYVLPEYDEGFIFSAREMAKRFAGETAYDPVSTMVKMAEFISRAHAEAREIIERTIELQAVNALLDGQLTLKNGDVIQYNQKVTHNVQTTTSWSNPNADIVGDVDALADLVRQDGKAEPDLLICGKDGLEGILNNTVINARINLRRVDIADIRMPTDGTRGSGAKFHGELSIGSYVYQLWTYPQVYTDPLGVTRKYLPDNKTIVMSSAARFDLNFGAVYRFADGNVEGFLADGRNNPLAIEERVEFAPYIWMGERGRAIEAGVRSSPLCVPTALDKLAVINTTQP